MQDRYVADIGDYGKYGLLNHLAERGNLKLCVVWLYTELAPGESGKSEGNKVGYLEEKRPELVECHPVLFSKLAAIWKHRQGRKCLKDVVEGKVLPRGTSFFNESFSVHDVPVADRERHRRDIMDNALKAMRGSDLVFFDPDNGIAGESYSRKRQRAGKYVFDDELAMFFQAGKSLLVYQHQVRKPRQKVLERYLQVVKGVGSREFVIFEYHRVIPRDYLLIINKRHSSDLRGLVSSFERTAWVKNGHFTIHMSR